MTLSLPDPESVARTLLSSSGIVGPPVNIELVLSSLPGLEVTEDDLDGDGLFYDLGVFGGHILIKRDAHPLRKKFTLAHEIGHFVVRDYATPKATAGRNAEIERWCNRFAAALLMPKDQVLTYLRDAKLSGILDAVRSGPRAFRVSTQAFRSRIAGISPASIYGFFRHSSAARRDTTYLSEEIRTHWKSEYNLILRNMILSDLRIRVDRIDDTIVVSGWPNLDQQAGDDELIIMTFVNRDVD